MKGSGCGLILDAIPDGSRLLLIYVNIPQFSV